VGDYLEKYRDHVSSDYLQIMQNYHNAINQYLPDATMEEIERFHEEPKNKKEEEENHFITSSLQAKALSCIGNKEEWINKPKEPHEKQTLGLLMLITAFYNENLKTVEDAKDEFKKQICEVLENSEDILRPILDEIKYLWEYERVIYNLYEFGFGSANITNLEKKDKHQVRAEKKAYLTQKKHTLEFLEKYDLPTKEVEEHIYEPDKIFLNRHYRQTLKLARHMFYEGLRDVGVGKRRANEITRILEYI